MNKEKINIQKTAKVNGEKLDVVFVLLTRKQRSSKLEFDDIRFNTTQEARIQQKQISSLIVVVFI